MLFARGFYKLNLREIEKLHWNVLNLTYKTYMNDFIMKYICDFLFLSLFLGPPIQIVFSTPFVSFSFSLYPLSPLFSLSSFPLASLPSLLSLLINLSPPKINYRPLNFHTLLGVKLTFRDYSHALMPYGHFLTPRIHNSNLKQIFSLLKYCIHCMW